MDDSKTTFGNSSRFSGLPLPRKVGLVVVLLFLGYGVADPAFLSDEAMESTYEVDHQEALSDFLAHMEQSGPTRRPAKTDSSVDESSVSNAEVASSGVTSRGSIQSVSYPQQAVETANSGNPESPEVSTENGDGMLILPHQTVDGVSAGVNAPPRIRLTGTIYPNSI